MVRLGGIIPRGTNSDPNGGRDDARREGRPSFPRQPALMPEKPEKGDSGVERLYGEAVAAMEAVLARVPLAEETDAGELISIIDRLANWVVLEGSALARLTHAPYERSALAVHCVNVAILSMVVGGELGMQKSELVTLGVAALLADVALAPLADVLSCPRELTRDELEKVRRHPVEAAAILSRFSGIEFEKVLRPIEQHHERCDGKGYPKGILADAIDPMAKIIGLVDVYEALTHRRPHRDKLVPYTAMKELAEATGAATFCPEHLRALIATLAIYPPGSYVELDTGEFARVYAANKDKPLRPIVDVILDNGKRRLPRIMRIDLSQGTHPCIVRPMSDTELKES